MSAENILIINFKARKVLRTEETFSFQFPYQVPEAKLSHAHNNYNSCDIESSFVNDVSHNVSENKLPENFVEENSREHISHRIY